MSGMSHDAMPDCDCGTEKAASCAQHCAALFAATLIGSDAGLTGLKLPDEAAPVVSASSFESRAGPPGLQPPR
jgi:hypothetical protein